MSRRQPYERPKPTPMGVYDGYVAVGEIEDWGEGDVRAFNLTPSGRVAIGTFADRRTAMRAVGRTDEAKKTATQGALQKFAEPIGFVSGLPGDVGGGGRRR
jgi:hypothetical protein